MPVTREQMLAAIACKRMQEDEQFQAVLTHITDTATQNSLYMTNAADRDYYRFMVLAVTAIRQEIEARADLPEAEEAREHFVRSMEE